VKALIIDGREERLQDGVVFLLLVTEWKQFRMPSFGVMKKSMKNALIIDGRNIYDPKELAEAGFEYSAIGC
jgi:UDPglucose 6-dehydrogenase